MNTRNVTRPVLTAIVGLTVLAVFVAGDMVQRWLQYDAAAILSGQWWRLLTQHLTHWDGSHLAWDVLVFLILGTVCELRNRRQFSLCLALAAPVISLTLLAGVPGLAFCRGLSGLDSALFALLLCQIAGSDRRKPAPSLDLAGAAALLFLGKCAWEYYTGTTLFVAHSAGSPVPMPLAHLAGFVCGLIGGGHLLRKNLRSPQTSPKMRWRCPRTPTGGLPALQTSQSELAPERANSLRVPGSARNFMPM
jgi:rhomboid family GlyGly-CTERM serine protease